MTKKQPTVAITGANGFLGSMLTQHFIAKGWDIVALVRNPTKQPKTHGVVYRHFDLSQPFDDKALQGVDYLVHTAYLKYDEQHSDALEVNLSSSQQLLAASRKHGLKKNIFISSMSAHDDAESIYGRQKLGIEKLFNTKQDISLRAGLIIGNGGIVQEMVTFMRSKHIVPLIGGGAQPLQSIGVRDLAAIIERVATTSLSGMIVAAHPEVFTYKTFYQTMAHVFHIRVFFVPLPLWLLLAMIKTARILHISLSFSEENVLGLKQLQAADNSKDIAKLGLQLKPLEAALRSTNL